MKKEQDLSIEELYLKSIQTELKRKGQEGAYEHFVALVPLVSYDTIKRLYENQDLRKRIQSTLECLLDEIKQSPLAKMGLNEELTYLLMLQPSARRNIHPNKLFEMRRESYRELLETARDEDDMIFFARAIEASARRFAFFKENEELALEVLKLAYQNFKKETGSKSEILSLVKREDPYSIN